MLYQKALYIIHYIIHYTLLPEINYDFSEFMKPAADLTLCHYALYKRSASDAKNTKCLHFMIVIILCLGKGNMLRRTKNLSGRSWAWMRSLNR